ncbi:MAG TPA: twin-arginine translocation (Tat) [Bradyrhizobium sp.]|nr:twin-arginine translocation (Tat) [Bradyrhizobium sp.]
MERRHFLKLTFGFIAGASVLAAGAEAAPLPPVTPEGQGLAPRPGERAEPAVTTQDDVDRLAPEQVRWRRRWGYRRRYWRVRRRRFWRRRYWGYRRRRFWRRRYWW